MADRGPHPRGVAPPRGTVGAVPGRDLGPTGSRRAARARGPAVAEAVVLDRWAGTSVSLGAVVDNLFELRCSAPRTASRTSVMTLVVVATNDDDAYRAEQAMHALGGHHPARLVVL